MMILYKLLNFIHSMLDRGRSEYLRSRMRCGSGVVIKEESLVYCPERVTLGDDVYIGPRVTIMAQGGVEIGADTMLGPGVSILSVNHDYTKPKPTVRSTQRKRPVSIGREVWIAGGAVVLPGVSIGDNAVVSAGSVVTSDVPANSIVAGIPARLIRERFRGGDADKESLPLFQNSAGGGENGEAVDD